MNRDVNESAARTLLATIFICVSLFSATLARAEEQRQYNIDIGQLPLSQALEKFSQQTGLQYGYLPTSDEEEQLMVGPVQGRLTASEVLAKLLPNGFTFEWTNPRTISILSPPVNPPPGGVNEAVAGKDQQRSELSKGQQLSMENGGGKGGSARGPYDFNWNMIVEASKVVDGLDLDIPTTVIEREDIEASGVSTLAELMGYVTQQPFATPESLLGDGTQVANVRGLGYDTTLVLINGRRTMATASSLAFNAFDLNSIPLGAVERVEIVSDSMSAIHGADAVGGVVNIVLRKNIPEPQLDIDYGAADGGGVERHATFGASGSMDRARGSIVLDYFDRGPLMGWERDRFSNQDFRRFGGVDWRSTIASPGNVRSAMFDNLPGLPSSFAAIPDVGPDARLTPADFISMAGRQNLESLYRYHSVAQARTRKGLVAHGEYAITREASIYGELMYVDRDSSAVWEPSALIGALVPRTNPHNPFGEDVMVDVLLTELGPRTVAHSSELTRVVGGARGQIHGWEWEASLHHSRDRDLAERTADLDPMRVVAALSETSAEDALNLFAGSGANNGELLASLLSEPVRNRSATEATQATAYLRGSLVSLPAGQMDLIVGGEWREEQVRYVVSAAAQDLPGSHQRAVSAAFGELRLPIVESAARIPAIHDLALVVSGRLDDYSDVGDSFNPEYAILWGPSSALDVRISWSESFRPPSLIELYLPRLEAAVPIVDTARGGELAFPIWRAGGNQELQPSSADSFAASVRFTPGGPLGLRLGAGYWRIHVDQTIGIPLAARLLNAESRFAHRIVREAPSAADLAAGLPGRLALIDITRLNFGSIRSSGVDFTAAMDFDTRVGRFTPDLTATWVHDFTTSDLLEGPGFSRVDLANPQGSITRWKGVASLKWNRGGFGISSALRYVPSYDDVDVSGHRVGRRVHSQSLLDLQLSLDLGEFATQVSPWHDFEIRAGALNLLDDQPPFAEVGWLAGFDASQSDLRQRFWYLKLAKKF